MNICIDVYIKGFSGLLHPNLLKREEEMKVIEVCDECTQNCVLIHGQKKDQSPVVISFLKLLYGNYDFSKFLYLPPEVSRKMSALSDQLNYDLVDSNGQRWTVKLANINNGLALDKGWHKFFTDHGLRVGDTLIFNYVIGSHFVVQIYGKTGCQKLNFPEANGNQRKRIKTKGKFLAEDGECQMNFNDLTNKQGSGTFVIAGSQNGRQSQPVTKDNNSSLENRNGRLQPALTTNYDIELMKMNKMSSCKGMNSGKDPKFFNELGQSSSRAEKGNDEVFKVAKTEPVFSFNANSPDTSNNSCLVVGSQALLELPECLPSISFRRANRKVVFLRGPNTRFWPVLYQEKYGLKALASGWEAFCKSYSLRPGDECVLGLENGPASIYSVNIVRK